VSAVSIESFEQACTEIVRDSRLPRTADDKEDVKEVVKQYLSDPIAGKWLLVVDNADDMQVLFGTGSSKGWVDFLPESEDGVTVFTSRRQEVVESLVRSDVIEVGKMNEEEAATFLNGLLREQSMSQSSSLRTHWTTYHWPWHRRRPTYTRIRSLQIYGASTEDRCRSHRYNVGSPAIAHNTTPSRARSGGG
jgi:hypothetical protein